MFKQIPVVLLLLHASVCFESMRSVQVKLAL